jgi:hypothetical protein
LGLSLCKQWWLTVHLEDLLKHTDLLKDRHDADEPDMDEYSKAEYARYLVDTYQDWPLAIEYLSYCPTRGKDWIKEVLIKIWCFPCYTGNYLPFLFTQSASSQCPFPVNADGGGYS